MNPGFDYGKGNGLAVVLAAVLIIAWPLALVAIVTALVWYVLRPTAKAAWRHRIITTVTAVVSVMVLVVGAIETARIVAGVGVVTVFELVSWRLVYPGSFARFVSGPIRRARRRAFYRAHWPDLATGLGLAAVHARQSWRGVKRTTIVPRLMSVSCGPWADELVVRPVLGQDLGTYEHAASALALHLGAHTVRTAAHDRASVRFTITLADPLAHTIPALAVPKHVDLRSLPVGVREDGTTWTLSLLDGNHTFVGGVTQAGKSSVVWSVLRALAPSIRDGRVQVWAIDPKIMEATLAPELFHQLATGRHPEGMVTLLEDAVTAMQHRADRLAGTVRTHTPSAAEPLVVIFVDELAFLTAWGLPKALRDRASQALSILCTQGRGPGFVVIAAAQDVRKDIVGMRNLFPVKIALRLDEKTQVDMLLGDGARNQGALCDQIPDTLPGVGFVKVDGTRVPARVRAAYNTDADVRHLATHYAPPHVPAVHRLAVHDSDDDGQGDELGAA